MCVCVYLYISLYIYIYIHIHTLCDRCLRRGARGVLRPAGYRWRPLLLMLYIYIYIYIYTYKQLHNTYIYIYIYTHILPRIFVSVLLLLSMRTGFWMQLPIGGYDQKSLFSNTHAFVCHCMSWAQARCDTSRSRQQLRSWWLSWCYAIQHTMWHDTVPERNTVPYEVMWRQFMRCGTVPCDGKQHNRTGKEGR